MQVEQGDAQVFAQISDPHMSQLGPVSPRYVVNKRLLGYLSWRRRRQREHHATVLLALHRDLEASPANHLLVTGDLTHIGLPDEFRQARAWLESLGPADRISVVPGNHDCYVREPWEKTYRHWLPYMASDSAGDIGSSDDCFPSLRVRGRVAFIGVSSAVTSPPAFATGRIGARQLEKLAGLLRQCEQRELFRVVYLHHPPLAGVESPRKHLVDAAALRAVVGDCGAELVLHGHSHRFLEGFMPGPTMQVPVVGLPSASALGLHGEVAGYNLYRVSRHSSGWELGIESRQYQPDRDCFVAVDRQALAAKP